MSGRRCRFASDLVFLRERREEKALSSLPGGSFHTTLFDDAGQWRLRVVGDVTTQFTQRIRSQAARSGYAQKQSSTFHPHIVA